MGASFSVLFLGPIGSLGSNGSSALQPKPSLWDLPKSCVALLFVNLDLLEICKLARLNRAYHGASLADFVWESKLPSNYEALVRVITSAQPCFSLSLTPAHKISGHARWISLGFGHLSLSPPPAVSGPFLLQRLGFRLIFLC
ncbi:hypothetical protein FH972_013232 [Carpinus fangiana]|uniref:F-box domain-containing protein n=1 Tax=Carpinus fangiana TaxID=176857 RepID=A0A5N6R625_9ROSI|nr:hypothetical protein FH972_013232 [Carpinus fangiana]